jgi:hypothetical protein
MGAESFSRAAVRTSECAEFIGELTLQFGPPLREVRVLITMRPISNVVRLADVSCSGVRLAVRRLISKWLHTFFRAFVNGDRVVIATRC